MLAHEIGHLELGHCFELVRSELLARRSRNVVLGRLADELLGILVRRGYSPAAEAESDAYAFALLVASRYDPAGLAASFSSMLASRGQLRPTGPLGELADTPSLHGASAPLRAAKQGLVAQPSWRPALPGGAQPGGAAQPPPAGVPRRMGG